MRVVVAAAVSAWSAVAIAAPAVVAVPEAAALSAPGGFAPTVVRTLPAGFAVCIVEAASAADPEPGEPRQWWMAQISKTQFAYLRTSDVQIITSSPTAAARCDANGFAPSPDQSSALTIGTAARATAAGAPVVAPDSDEPGPISRPLPADGIRAGHLLPLDPLRFTFGLASGAGWLNRSAAQQHHIGTAGPTIYLTVGMALFDVIGVSAAFGAVFPEDHATFEQDVVPLLGGGVRRASSSLQVTNYSIAVGPRTPLLVLKALPDGRAWVAALFADYGRSVIHGDRFISDCDDCRTEDLALPGGTFWRIGADIGLVRLVPIDPGFLMTISYQRYLPGAGFSQEIRAGFVFWFL